MPTIAEMLFGNRENRVIFDFDSLTVRQQGPDPEQRGALQRVFDILNTGLYASASVADAILRGDGQLASAAWRGLTHQERKTFVDVLQAHRMPGAPLVGFILDIGLDPLTYIPVAGQVEKLARAAKGAKWYQAAVDAIRQNDLVDIIGRAFSTTWKKPQEYVDTARLRRYWFREEQRQLLDEVKQLVERIPEKRRRLLSYARENPELVSKLTAEEQEVLNHYSKEFTQYLDRAVQNGLLTMEAAGDAAEMYLPHRFNARLRELGIELTGREFRPIFARKRSFKTLAEIHDYRGDVMRIARANDMARATQIAEALDSKWAGDDFAKTIRALGDIGKVRAWAKEVVRYHTPIDDFAKLIGLYKNEWLQYEARTQFLDEVLSKWGTKVPADMIPPPDHGIFLPRGNLRFFAQEALKVPIKTTEAGAKAAGLKRSMEFAEYVAKALERGDELVEVPSDLIRQMVGVTGNVDAYLLPKPIADDLNRVNRFLFGDPATRGLIGLFDRIMGNWKSAATVWRLPFHIRNLYGNYFMAWLGGMDVGDMVPRSLDAIRLLRGEMGQAMLDKARRLGVVSSGFFHSDFENYLADVERLMKPAGVRGAVTKALGLPKERPEWLDKAINAPRQVGTAIENVSRVAMWLDGLNKGMDEIQAARRVMRYLFDYSELTDFERHVMRRIVPFYTFLRKSIPVLLHTMVTNPQKYAVVGRGFDALNEWADFRHEDAQALPPYMLHFGWVKLPWERNGKQVYAYIDFPVTQLDKLPTREGWLELISGLSPVFDALLIQLNVKPFPIGERGAEKLERFPGDLRPAPGWVVYAPEIIQRWLGVEEMNWRGRRVVGWSKKRQAQLYTFMPAARELERFWPPAYVEPEDAPWRIASWVTGVNVRPVDLNQERLWRRIEAKDKLAQVTARMSQLGRPLTDKELEEMLR